MVGRQRKVGDSTPHNEVVHWELVLVLYKVFNSKPEEGERMRMEGVRGRVPVRYLTLPFSSIWANITMT